MNLELLFLPCPTHFVPSLYFDTLHSHLTPTLFTPTPIHFVLSHTPSLCTPSLILLAPSLFFSHFPFPLFLFIPQLFTLLSIYPLTYPLSLFSSVFLSHFFPFTFPLNFLVLLNISCLTFPCSLSPHLSFTFPLTFPLSFFPSLFISLPP